jgi:hypothetical protein
MTAPESARKGKKQKADLATPGLLLEEAERLYRAGRTAQIAELALVTPSGSKAPARLSTLLGMALFEMGLSF